MKTLLFGLFASAAFTPDSMAPLFFPTHIILLLLVLLAGVILYFLPFLIARHRGVDRMAGIVLLNVFLGWTGIGWFGCLIWAASAETKTQIRSRQIDYDGLARAISAASRSAPPPPPEQ